MIAEGHRFRMIRVGRLDTMHPLVRDISVETLARKDVQHHEQTDNSAEEVSPLSFFRSFAVSYTTLYRLLAAPKVRS